MSYDGALTAAGATVHECKFFGSYQGDWIAEVTLPDGRRGIITGSYGSCSGCDAFEAELGSDYHGWETGDSHDAANKPVDGCEKCAEYHAKLVAFGRDYFDAIQDAEALAEHYATESYWSSYNETREAAQFVLARCVEADPRTVKLRERLTKPDEL